MKTWLNWALFMIVFLVVVHSIVVNSRMYLAGSRWQAGRQIGNTAQNKNQPSCLKVSDFYSVHLTTYFLAATGLGDMDPKDKAKRTSRFATGSQGQVRLFSPSISWSRIREAFP